VLSFNCEAYRAIFGDEVGAILFRWKKHYSESVLRMRLDGRKEEEVQRDTGVTFAVGSAVLFLVAWILSDVWEAMVMLLASGLLFAGISAGAFGKMVQEKRKRMKALEETKDK